MFRPKHPGNVKDKMHLKGACAFINQIASKLKNARMLIDLTAFLRFTLLKFSGVLLLFIKEVRRSVVLI